MNILLFAASILTVVGIYAILALSLNLTNGLTGIIDFGVMAWVAIGAYAYTLITIDPPGGALSSNIIGLHWPIWVGIVAAFIFPALFGVFIGLPTLRLRGEYLGVASYAFSMVIVNIFTNETWLTNGVKGFFGIEQPFKMYFNSNAYTYVLLAIVSTVCLIVYIVVNRITHSPFGRTLRAIRENEEVAVSIGKDPWKYRMTVYVLASSIAGLAGGLFVWYTTVIVPGMFTSTMTFTVWIALILGGMGNNRGAILGALLLISAQEMTRFLQSSGVFAIGMRYICIGILMIIIIRYKRRGLIPEKSNSY